MVSFLLEVGTEELPATFVETAIQQWKQKIPASLSEQFLTFESVQVYGTPRRLAVVIEGLPSQQPDREEEIKGPPATTAFKDGKPTPVAEGFIKKQGVTLEDLEIRPTSKGDFVFVLKKIPGRLTGEILAELTSKWITKLEGKRFMSWGNEHFKFPRPIRWLITLLDDQVLPFSLFTGFEQEIADNLFSKGGGPLQLNLNLMEKLTKDLQPGDLPKGVTGIKSDRISQGHRVLHRKEKIINYELKHEEVVQRARLNWEKKGYPMQDKASQDADYFNAQCEFVAEFLWKQKGCPIQDKAGQDEDYLNAKIEIDKALSISPNELIKITIPNTEKNTGNNDVLISKVSDYIDSLREAYIEVDPEQRRAKIEDGIQKAAKRVGGKAEIPEDLLAEVVNLVEWPTAVVGTFDQEFLDLPAEVIKTVMVTHQRYFPILTTETQNSSPLKPYFITISNGDPAKSDLIAAGNERVIRARLADGQFFYKSDLKNPLESYLPSLEAVTFQEDLGSVRDKVNRITKIANWISDQLNISESDRSLIQRAALLCKADLVTQMVYEFPELQGVMGEKYARKGGEPEAVGTAIFEHYLPRSATDNLPQTLVGQVVGLADKLDTLVSIFGLGMLPTGSSDPFALRRAANAVVNIIWAADLPLNLYQLLKQIAVDFVNSFPNAILGLNHELYDFFLQRIRTLLQDEKAIDYDLVNAVLGENDLEYQERALQDLLDVRDRALFLQTIRKDGSLNQIYETVNRSTRLAKQGELNTLELQPEMTVDPELFQKSSERQFYQALVQLVPQTQASQATRNYRQLVEALAEITPTVSSFFDGPESVLVMDDDPNIQRNRLNLLGLLRNHARVLADFGAIVKS